MNQILKFLSFAVAFAVAAIAIASPPTPPASTLKANVTSGIELVFDNGCALDSTEYDGTLDYFGTSGGSDSTSDAGNQNTMVIAGAAVSSWEGTGTRTVGVARTLRINQGSTSAMAAVIINGRIGFTMEVTLTPVTGSPVTHIFTQQPVSSGGTTTIVVPLYDGQLAEVEVNLQAIGAIELSAETLVPQCHLAQFWSEVVGTASITL